MSKNLQPASQQMSNEFRIPRLIHQMWLDKKVKNNSECPKKYSSLGYPQSWKSNNPTFEYRLWNRESVDELFSDPRLKKWKRFYYWKINKHIERCDFARYAILFLHGGTYCDLDFMCCKSIQPLLESRDVGLVLEPMEHSDPISDGVRRRLYNGFIMSVPHHWLWPSFMDYIVSHYRRLGGPHKNTGPIAFAKFSEELRLQTNHPEFFLQTCLIMPLISLGRISSQCPTDALLNAYTWTKWHEGTGWGMLTLSGDSNGSMWIFQSHSALWITLAVVIFVVLIVLAVVLTLVFLKNRRKTSPS